MSLVVADILETCLYVDDLEKAEDFYTKALGLEVYGKVDGRHVFFQCGGRMLLLFDPRQSEQGGELPPHGAPPGGHVAFSVAAESVDQWKAKLEEAGVAVEVDYLWGDRGRSLYFRDPFGNSLELATPGIWGLVEDG